jgi:NADPH-dependent 7-cyano-7-deazaguanine reductase QueF-like protein
MAGKRELIEPKGDKRYVRRDEKGRFEESDDVGRSLSRDVRTKAKTKVEPGQGDRGDRK